MNDILTKVNPNILYTININNSFKIDLTDSDISMFTITLVIILLSLILSRKAKIMPSKRQNLIEAFIEFIAGILENAIEGDVYKFVPFIGTIFIYLILANTVDVINVIIPNLEIAPPTKDINLVLSLAMISVSSIIYYGIKYKNFKGWLHGFLEPIPIILPFKILDYFIKPISLTLRLFGNIVAGFLIMLVIYSLIPAGLPGFACLYFDVFDGILQAYIFVFLTSLYIGEAIEKET